MVNLGDEPEREITKPFCCDLLSIAMGKAPAGVAARAKIAGASVIGIAGCVTDDAYLCNDKGIDAIFPVIDRSMTLEEAMDKTTTVKNIKKTVTQIFRLIKAAGR